MTEAVAALLGASIGAIAGFGGGGLAALAALRSSQIAARAPLAPRLHELGRAVVKARTATPATRDETRLAFEQAWNDFRVHQGILCPSRRISVLLDLLRLAVLDDTVKRYSAIDLSGQLMEKITQMVSAHSARLLRSSALNDERSILHFWLSDSRSNILSAEIKSRLRSLADDPDAA